MPVLKGCIFFFLFQFVVVLLQIYDKVSVAYDRNAKGSVGVGMLSNCLFQG